MDKEARRTLEHALGTMPRQDPRTHDPATPSRWDLTEPRLAPEVPGCNQTPLSSPCPLEKHGTRPSKRGWTKSKRFQAVEELPWSWAGVMIKARPRKFRIHGACCN
ncbi:hypothetical protein Syun_020449 [Stephania yunnanensis]|uniref:Uncharacterized protein n=1 Tax=Stephania yunnanensis TaxID=152371 RepID=A0AAP0IE93_9MAGN